MNRKFDKSRFFGITVITLKVCHDGDDVYGKSMRCALDSEPELRQCFVESEV